MMKKTEAFNKLYSEYYNLFYSDKNYLQEVDYIDRVIRTYYPQASTIIEYGSGTGGHGILLQDKGYQIQGIELSPEMAKIATDKGYNCQVGDITSYSLPIQFDVCLALFHVVSYITENNRLLQLLRNTRKHLVDGGIFIFDVWFSPAVFFQVPEVRVKKVGNENMEATRIAQPVLNHVSNTVEVNYHIFVKQKGSMQIEEFTEKHLMRHFGFPEIDLLASESGFSVIKAEEFLTGNSPSENTWGVNFILKAK